MDWTSDEIEGSWQAVIGTVEVRFGDGRLEEVGAATAGLGIERPLLVSDPGVRAAGHAATATRALEAVGLAVELFDGVGENPTSRQVARGAAAAAAHGADGLVAVGGGSAMDCAKGINFVYTGGGSMPDYRGYGRASRPLLQSVGVPTTAGTGSEAQSYALISDDRTHEKMLCGDPGAAFGAVILDPELLRTAPAAVTATAGLDAVSHAVESFVTTRRNPRSSELARAAWRLLEGALETVLAGGANGRAWSKLLLGAHLAGAAIERSMLGAAHATANPLTARYELPHGEAVALMLPSVVRFNGATCEPLYGELIGNGAGGAAEALAARLEELRGAAGLPRTLRQAGVERSELAAMARRAAAQWTARFNPRPVGAQELRGLYEAAW